MQPDDSASKRSSQTAAGGDDVPKAADAAEPAVTTQYPPAADAEKGAPAAELSPYGAHVFADGGRKAWLTVAGACVVSDTAARGTDAARAQMADDVLDVRPRVLVRRVRGSVRRPAAAAR